MRSGCPTLAVAARRIRPLEPDAFARRAAAPWARPRAVARAGLPVPRQGHEPGLTNLPRPPVPVCWGETAGGHPCLDRPPLDAGRLPPAQRRVRPRGQWICVAGARREPKSVMTVVPADVVESGRRTRRLRRLDQASTALRPVGREPYGPFQMSAFGGPAGEELCMRRWWWNPRARNTGARCPGGRCVGSDLLACWANPPQRGAQTKGAAGRPAALFKSLR